MADVNSDKNHVDSSNVTMEHGSDTLRKGESQNSPHQNRAVI